MDYSKNFRFVHAKKKRVERDIELVRLGKNKKRRGREREKIWFSIWFYENIFINGKN